VRIEKRDTRGEHPHRQRRKQLADVEAEDADVLDVSEESDEAA
jgi:hypothetical protein